MNTAQKTILTAYLLLLLVGAYSMFFGFGEYGDGGVMFFSTLIGGTPVAILLFFIWKSKGNKT